MGLRGGFGFLVCGAALLGLVPATAYAVEGGYSNYMPGAYGDFEVALPPDVGLTYSTYFYFYQAKGEQAVRAGRVEEDVQLFNFQLTPYLVFAPKKHWLKAQVAFGLGVTVEYVETRSNPLMDTVRTEADAFGIGDIYLLPLSMTWSVGSRVYLNLYHGITAPVGKYNSSSSVNTTLNYWSFDSNLAFTYLNPKPNIEVSADVGHIYNTRNNATDYHSGQEFHLSYMVNYYFKAPVGLGVQGSFYHQVTGDRGAGALLGPNQAQVAGVGPAVRWEPEIRRTPVYFIAKWQYEYHQRNRLRGHDVWLYFGLSWDVGHQ